MDRDGQAAAVYVASGIKQLLKKLCVKDGYRRIVKAVIYHRKRKGRSLHNRGCDQSLIRKYILMNGNP